MTSYSPESCQDAKIFISPGLKGCVTGHRLVTYQSTAIIGFINVEETLEQLASIPSDNPCTAGIMSIQLGVVLEYAADDKQHAGRQNKRLLRTVGRTSALCIQLEEAIWRVQKTHKRCAL